MKVPKERARGLCWCGCGEKTSLAAMTSSASGNIKGKPVRYLPNHHTRKSPIEYVEEDRGFATPCWIWQRGISDTGYGTLRVDGKAMNAHRVFYLREHGTIPDGHELHHLCEVKACVNPSHVIPVTPKEHTRLGRGIATQYLDRTHCKNGHEWNEENTYIRRDNGYRQCRACMRERMRKRRAQAKSGPRFSSLPRIDFERLV